MPLIIEFTRARNLVVLVSPDSISRRRRPHLLYFNYDLRSEPDDSTGATSLSTNFQLELFLIFHLALLLNLLNFFNRITCFISLFLKLQNLSNIEIKVIGGKDKKRMIAATLSQKISFSIQWINDFDRNLLSTFSTFPIFNKVIYFLSLNNFIFYNFKFKDIKRYVLDSYGIFKVNEKFQFFSFFLTFDNPIKISIII